MNARRRRDATAVNTAKNAAMIAANFASAPVPIVSTHCPIALQRVRSALFLPLASNVGRPSRVASLQRNGKRTFEPVLTGPIS